ncbi:sentrin-specific protease 7 [Thraustotheca clavata]|uniref:Sentrin-specific protease 7 n=1 Tax=Thraustotheca clavata TaxID=74557 RepID=A0A1W0AC96_9STRA|nr:sentrin-specific protease 7 [Thraustotheca clavata]
MELIEIEIPACKANSLLKLRLHEATEDGIGAVFVKCDFESRLKRLPPFRYQLYSFGNESLVSLPFQEILDKLAATKTFPNMIRLISCPLAWNLYFPKHKKKLNLKIERSNDAVQIQGYEKPYRTPSQIPNLILGSQYIAAVNGILACDINNQKLIALLKDPNSYPLTLRIDIKQDENSKVLQRPQFLLRYSEKCVILSKRRTGTQVQLPQPNAMKKRKQVTSQEVPTTPATSIENPIEILDSSDEEVKQIDLTPSKPSKVEQFTRNKAVSTPLGIGTILGTKSTAAGKIVKVQLPFGKGYFHQLCVKGIDEIPFAIYKRSQAKGQVLLTYGDIIRLEETQLFNDTILDFYLSYLMDTLNPTGVYVCSTFLYGHYQRARPEGADKAYAAVKNWTKGINLFETKFLVVPVNEKGHWSVAIVCNLYQLTQKEYCRCAFFQVIKHQLPNSNCSICQLPRNLHREVSDRVCIMVLDSLKCHKTSRITRFLREYLQMEWDMKHKATIAPLDVSKKTLPTIVPLKIPRQVNNVDCGVFLLHYVELFLQNPPQLNMDVVAARKPTTPGIGVQLDETWFSLDDIPAKRKELQRLVRDPSVVTLLDAPEKSSFSINTIDMTKLEDSTFAAKRSVKTPEKTTKTSDKATKTQDETSNIPQKPTKSSKMTSNSLETNIQPKTSNLPKESIKSPRDTKSKAILKSNIKVNLDELSMPENNQAKQSKLAPELSQELENIVAVNGPVSVNNGSIWIF